jgi:hypothetical protein
VPLVNRLGPVHAAVQLWGKVLGKSDQCLNSQEDISSKAKNGMGGLEMGAIVVELVHFNDDQTCDEEINSEAVQTCVSDCSLPFLSCRMRRLKDKNRLCENQNTSGVEERMCGEEYETVEEDASPDRGCEENNAGLGNDGGAWRKISGSPGYLDRSNL